MFDVLFFEIVHFGQNAKEEVFIFNLVVLFIKSSKDIWDNHLPLKVVDKKTN